MIYYPRAWFWLVAGDTSRAWSSAAGAYVTQWDAERVTRIASEAELNGVLSPYGLVLPAPTGSDYSAAIQKHVDATAQTKGYADAHGIATYAGSTVPAWAAEAQAFVAWRDQVWLYAYTEMGKVQSNQRTQPSIAEIIAELPPITWPA